jgi:hypothetical protein
MEALRERFRLSYHVPYVSVADKMVGLSGKDVLEVGGSLPADFVLETVGVRSWVAVGPGAPAIQQQWPSPGTTQAECIATASRAIFPSHANPSRRILANLGRNFRDDFRYSTATTPLPAKANHRRDKSDEKQCPR